MAEDSGARARYADLARDVLTQAEQEVRALQSQGLTAAEQAARSRDIVVRAQREVSDILARGRNEPESSDVHTSLEPAVAQFASLCARAVPSEEGELRYLVSGRLTLATMLAFQQAVSRVPGVTSARVAAEPHDVAVLRMETSDPAQVQRLLVAIPGVKLEIDRT